MPRELAVRAALWVHLAGAAGFLWLQPRGFTFGSRSFLEHQVLVPLFFVVSLFAAGCPSRHPRARRGFAAAVAGFWVAIGGVVAITGSTLSARGMWGVLAGALAGGALLLRRPEGRWPSLLGLAGGGAMASLFLAFTWAPPATTRPLRAAAETPARVTREGPRISVEGRGLTVESAGKRLVLDPGFHFSSASRSGLWTLFDFRSEYLPPWTTDGVEGLLRLRATSETLEVEGLAWVDGDEVHVAVRTTVREDVAAHLASAMTVGVPGPVRVNGLAWSDGWPATFMAFRGGALELLRATRLEKGPFTTLGSWPPADPVVESEDWTIQVRGWAEQASRAESPTAGWGVSQGAIENRGGTLSWSLASTSIGRGWHAVRTAAGVYSLEIVIRPRL